MDHTPCAMPVPATCWPKDYLSRRLATILGTVIRAPHASTPRSIWKACGKSPVLTWEACYETTTSRRPICFAQTIAWHAMSDDGPPVTGLLQGQRRCQCRWGRSRNGTCVHLRQWSSHFQFAWQVSCLTWFLSLPVKPRLPYELTAPSSDPKGTGAFDTL